MKRRQQDELLNEGLIDAELAAEEEEIKSRKFKYGTLATIFTIVFIVAIILVNVLLGYMTDRFVWEIDMTREQLFEISEDTKEVIDDLNRDVLITVLSDETSYRDSTELLSNLYEILQRYEALGGGKIKVRYISPNMNPKIFDQYNELGDLGQNYIIVETDLRKTYMPPTSMYNMKVDQETNTTYYVGLRAEQRLTSALLFVTQESVNTACYIRGHGEDYGLDELSGLLVKMNYDTTNIILAQEDIPEECTLLIISSPDTDYSIEEVNKLHDYFMKGGDAIVSLTPQTSTELTNLNTLFEEWGVEYKNQMILDNYQSLSGYPMYVVPTIASIENVTEKLNTRNYFAIVPAAMPIEMTGTEASNVKVRALMTSSARSYAKDLEQVSMGYDQEETDEVGPFNMCVISEYVVSDKNLNYTRSDIVFCTAGLISDTVLSPKASNFLNAQFIETLVDYISEYNDLVVIEDKNFESNTLNILTWQIRVCLWVVVIAMPLAILVIGIVIWSKRRHL
jgi:ABC-type uncharacterized transport system involved in gliding motility auxiliary subunit